MKASKTKTAVILIVLLLLTVPHAYPEEGIRIAAIYALTGNASSANRASLAGVRLAVRELNRHGGVLGRPLVLLEIDNRSTPIGSKVAADEAARHGVVAIVGADWSSHSLAAARVAQKRSIPMVTNVSTHPDVTKIGDCIFRTCYTDAFQGLVMARFAREDLKARTAVVIKDVASDYSVGLAEVFVKDFEKAGGEVLGEFAYEHYQESFEETARLAGRLRPEIVFIPGHDESGAIVRSAVQQGLSAVFLGGDGWVTESFLERGGRFAQEAYFCSHWSTEVQTEASRQFMSLWREYDRKDSGALSASAALAFDAVMLIDDALERAGSADRDALRTALSATNGFEGVTGRITFNEQGDPIKDAVVMEVSNGRVRYLKRVTLQTDAATSR